MSDAATIHAVPRPRRPLAAGAAAVLLAVLLAVAPAGGAFDDDFTGATLRLDLYHLGTGDEERYTLDRARIEGPWPGSRTQLLDPTNLGESLVEVVDAASNRVLYTRGFATIFGEWQTTGEALGGAWTVLPETVRVPEPKRPVQVRLRQRGSDGAFLPGEYGSSRGGMPFGPQADKEEGRRRLASALQITTRIARLTGRLWDLY